MPEFKSAVVLLLCAFAAYLAVSYIYIYIYIYILPIGNPVDVALVVTCMAAVPL